MSDHKDYFSCAETAKLLRGALKAAFPGIKFSVVSDTYSGGASIRVRWTDGPTTIDVDRIAKRYEGSDFDGMIDLKTYNSSWLLPDGSVVFASTPGTVGSRGFIPAQDHPKPHPDARLVHFGADYVFTERSFTPALLAKAKEYAEAHPITTEHLYEGEIIVYVPDEDRLDPSGAQTHTAPPERAYAWLADHARIGYRVPMTGAEIEREFAAHPDGGLAEMEDAAAFVDGDHADLRGIGVPILDGGRP